MNGQPQQATGMERKRIDTIDLWRGLVLVVIFINHVPGNLLEHVTMRNFGFSDSAEAFVFVSGLAVSLAYFPKLRAGDWPGTARRCVKRAVKLYGVHLLLTFAALVMFGQAFLATGITELATSHGRDISFMEPGRALAGLLLLSHQIGYFNILPLYVVLMLAAIPLLALAWVRPLLALALSAAVYAWSRVTGFGLPTWPAEGRWFFDPLCWQLLFTIGIVCGVMWRGGKAPFSRALFWLCVAWLAAGAVMVTNVFGLAPGVYDAARAWLDLSKTDLGLGRLTHFLALAYVLSQMRVGEALLRLPGADKLTLMGRHGLAVFAAGSLASAGGQILLAISHGSPIVGVVYVVAGIFGLVAFASLLECRSTAARAGKAASQPVAARGGGGPRQ
ncbi:OpgC family protein [Camelimonas abortus]|uniref:OpgC family protein n=1 Tax=Camelimonas abortus TaxID=1017184 RepID=A0ABV7LGM7_9HYPH